MQIVYGLEDQRDKLFHYIGITDDVYTRFIAHIKGSGGNIEKNGWIFECRQHNSMILMKELERIERPSEEIELARARERERYWVKHYLDLGHPLHNIDIARSILKERVTRDKKVGQVVCPPRMRPSVQSALEVYQPEMSCRTLAGLLNCGKDKANEIIQVIKRQEYIKQSAS